MSEHTETSTFLYAEQMAKPKPNAGEQQYLDFLAEIIEHGHRRETRNATTRSLFSRQLKFDLADGFPLLTTKTMFWRGIVEELKFFLSGSTDATILDKAGVKIWNDNTSRAFLDSVGLNHYVQGDMGPLYGFQWRHFGATYRGCQADYSGQGTDQLQYVVDVLARDPFSRRAFMTTFHTDQLTQSPLPPCHGLTVQFGVDKNYRLDCHMYQRSCDAFLGCPFNIASYALLMHIVCALVNSRGTELNSRGTPFLAEYDPSSTGFNQTKSENSYTLVPGILTMSFGDCHVYESHVDAVREQLQRKPYAFPSLAIDGTLTMDTIQNINCSTANRRQSCSMRNEVPLELSVNATAKKGAPSNTQNTQEAVTLHLSDYKHYSSIKANMIA
jgi:thymidylate synthase